MQRENLTSARVKYNIYIYLNNTVQGINYLSNKKVNTIFNSVRIVSSEHKYILIRI